MKKLLILFLVFAAGCNENPVGPTGASLDQQFSLQPGQEVLIRDVNLVLKFQSVTEDSRCPDNARCIWAGNGKLLIELRESGRPSYSTTINTLLDPRVICYLNYQVHLLGLAPYPHAPDRINPGDYIARFVVTRGCGSP